MGGCHKEQTSKNLGTSGEPPKRPLIFLDFNNTNPKYNFPLWGNKLAIFKKLGKRPHRPFDSLWKSALKFSSPAIIRKILQYGTSSIFLKGMPNVQLCFPFLCFLFEVVKNPYDWQSFLLLNATTQFCLTNNFFGCWSPSYQTDNHAVLLHIFFWQIAFDFLPIFVFRFPIALFFSAPPFK